GHGQVIDLLLTDGLDGNDGIPIDIRARQHTWFGVVKDVCRAHAPMARQAAPAVWAIASKFADLHRLATAPRQLDHRKAAGSDRGAHGFPGRTRRMPNVAHLLW